MLNWHTPEIYNKIGAYPVQVSIKQMPLAATEIERLNTLDPREISALHDQYYPEVYRFARFRVSDETLAEDIASEVFMRLLEAVHKRQGPKSNLKMWLIRTASNIVSDHYRNQYHHPAETPAEVLESHTDLFLTHPDPALMNEQEETNESVRAAINQLTDMQKLVITLRFGNRYSLEDTARLMGKEINTIKALQFRALESLRRLLGGERP